VAADLVRTCPVPQRVAGERGRELRELADRKGSAYRARRAGEAAEVVLERGDQALTGDYLRVGVRSGRGSGAGGLRRGLLRGSPAGLYIDLASSPSPPVV
jgi:hypothetical protein